MPNYPSPHLELALDPPSVQAGYDKPVKVKARVTNRQRGVHYWFEFRTTSGEIRKSGFWGTPAKGAVVATTNWFVSGVGPAEAAVEVEATIYEERQRKGKGEVTASDAIILIVEEGIDVSLDIETGEDCGDFVSVRQGELICLHGTINTKGKSTEHLVFEPHVWFEDGGPEFEIEYSWEDDPLHFKAWCDSEALGRGRVKIFASVETHRVPGRSRSATKGDPDVSLAAPVRAGTGRRKKTPVKESK